MTSLRCPTCGHEYGEFESAMLGVIETGEAVTTTDLAERLGCSVQAASNTARRLVRKGRLGRTRRPLLPAGGHFYEYAVPEEPQRD
jgi:predicted transcriptional regulator